MAIYSPILTYFGAIIIIKENLYTYIHTHTSCHVSIFTLWVLEIRKGHHHRNKQNTKGLGDAATHGYDDISTSPSSVIRQYQGESGALLLDYLRPVAAYGFRT